VSESEHIAPRDPEETPPLGASDDLVKRLDVRPPPEREGLPRSYRMRADAHYVEQLGAPNQPVIRLLEPAKIECKDLPPPDGLDALTKSIAAHGVIQPLIVRRHGIRHTLIAGRKRLAAWIAGGVGMVPCLVHDVDAAGALAIAEADNLRIDVPEGPGEVDRTTSRLALQALASDLTTIRSSMSLLKTTSRASLQQQVGVDLIETQAARAAWLASCMLGTVEEGRLVPLGAIIQRVADSFASYGRLTGVELDCSVTPPAAVWKLPEDAMTAVINGALFTTLGCLEGVAAPRVEVNAEAVHTRSLKIEVVQRAVRLARKFELNTADPESLRPEDLVPALALRMAQAIAALYGGNAEFSPLPGFGSVMRITFFSPQPMA
jgi:hypothetical protein